MASGASNGFNYDFNPHIHVLEFASGEEDFIMLGKLRSTLNKLGLDMPGMFKGDDIDHIVTVNFI
jgi:hypothetical protein